MIYKHEKNDEEASRESKPRKLTARQERYAKERANGKSYPDAYYSAGYSARQARETATSNAYTLEHVSAASSQILDRITYYQKQAEKGAIADRAARMALLTDLAYDEAGTGKKDRLRALDMLAKMSGDYSETIVNHVSAAVEIDRKQVFDDIRAKLEP